MLASYRVVSLSHCVRSLSSCLLFGFSLLDLPCFLGLSSGLVRLRRDPSLFCPVFPVPCVSYCVLAFRSCLIRRVRSARRSLLRPSRYRVGLALVPSFSQPGVSEGGEIIEAVAVCGPGVSLLAPVASASVVSVRSRSPVAPRVSVCLLGGVVSFLDLRRRPVGRSVLSFDTLLAPLARVVGSGRIVSARRVGTSICLPRLAECVSACAVIWGRCRSASVLLRSRC